MTTTPITALPTWLSLALSRAADTLKREGWNPGTASVMDTISAIAISPHAPYDAHELCIQARQAITAHLNEPLSDWEVWPFRTHDQVIAMLREVAAANDARECAR
jgi:hypothetical protein